MHAPNSAIEKADLGAASNGHPHLNYRKQDLQQEPALRRVNATLWQFVSSKARYYNMRKGGKWLMVSEIKDIVATAVLISALLASPVSVAEVSQNYAITNQNVITVQNGDKSSSIIFPRSSGGITRIGIERLDAFQNAYVTMVTAYGPTIDEAAMAAATLQTFTNLKQQSSFVDTESITFAYNQTKPSYVISELERAKLISPAEAQAARAAFDSLQSQMAARPGLVRSTP